MMYTVYQEALSPLHDIVLYMFSQLITDNNQVILTDMLCASTFLCNLIYAHFILHNSHLKVE